jgi:hypothetical protein
MRLKLVYLIFLYQLNIGLINAQQNVLITDNTTSLPDGSSLLELNSTNKGLLIPRVSLQSTTDGTTISLPAVSLLVYNTNASILNGAGIGYYFNAGSNLSPDWQKILSGNTVGEWKLLGNSGTNASLNFLGTTDNADLVFRTNNIERVRTLSSNGYVGVGETNPISRLHVSNGDLRLGEVSTIAGSAGYGRLMYFSGGSSFLTSSENTDPLIIGRYNVASDESELRFIIGDNNGYGGTEIDRLVIGNGNIATSQWNPKFTVRSDGKTTISRDGVGECCGNDATLVLAESTQGTGATGRRASISFHNAWEAEGTLQLIHNTINGISSRRIQLYDNQSQGLGLEIGGSSGVMGRFWFGNSGTRTESRDNAGLQGNVGAQSGFYETSSPSNFPSGASSWWHLIDSRHSNISNNYAMQLSGSFFDQDLYLRKTNNNPSQSWSRAVTSRDIATHRDVGVFSSSTKNAWVDVTGSTGSIDVKAGDVLKFDGMMFVRLTAGNNNDYFYFRIRISGCVNTTNDQIGYFHATEDGAEHDNFKPIPISDFWQSTCNGQVNFSYQVYMQGDDNWEVRNRILIATRY